MLESIIDNTLTFETSLKILNIEDYKDAILNSNSHGELFHITDYIILASVLKDKCPWFKEWFLKILEYSKLQDRPESVFQHILELFQNSITNE
jgi:hypothetical protein